MALFVKYGIKGQRDIFTRECGTLDEMRKLMRYVNKTPTLVALALGNSTSIKAQSEIRKRYFVGTGGVFRYTSGRGDEPI